MRTAAAVPKCASKPRRAEPGRAEPRRAVPVAQNGAILSLPAGCLPAPRPPQTSCAHPQQCGSADCCHAPLPPPRAYRGESAPPRRNGAVSRPEQSPPRCLGYCPSSQRDSSLRCGSEIGPFLAPSSVSTEYNRETHRDGTYTAQFQSKAGRVSTVPLTPVSKRAVINGSESGRAVSAPLSDNARRCQGETVIASTSFSLGRSCHYPLLPRTS